MVGRSQRRSFVRIRSALFVAAALALSLASARSSSALPVRSAGGLGPEVPVAIAVCAPASPTPLVLLGQRVLLQPLGPDGPVPVAIPSFAGQWAPIFGSPVSAGDSPAQTAARLFAAQTGVALPDASKAEVRADPSDFGVTRSVLVSLSEAELRGLAAAANAAIAAHAPPEGVLAQVDAVTFPEALSRLGPVPPPEGGWASYVVQNVYGGVQPGAFDVVYPMLVQTLALRTQATTDAFHTALLLAAQACTAPGPTPTPAASR